MYVVPPFEGKLVCVFQICQGVWEAQYEKMMVEKVQGQNTRTLCGIVSAGHTSEAAGPLRTLDN